MEKFTISGEDFIKAVEKTAHIALIPKPKHYSYLTNICMITHNDKVDFTAVDSGVLIVYTVPAKVEKVENQKHLINAKALKYIADRTAKSDEIEITIESRGKTTSYKPDAIITFKSTNYDLKTKLLGGFLHEEYPDYRKILPKQYDATVEISKQTLLGMLNAVKGRKSDEIVCVNYPTL